MRAEAIWRGDASGGIAAHPRFFGWEGFSGKRALLARRALNAPAYSFPPATYSTKTVAWKSLRLEGVGCLLEALPETEAAASARRV